MGERIQALRRDAHAIWLAIGDTRTPWYAKAWGWLVAAYALSPIDLIPDFVPFLGLIDDLLILPVGIWVFVKLVPGELFVEHLKKAEIASENPVSRSGAILVVAIWLMAFGLIGLYVWSWRYW